MPSVILKHKISCDLMKCKNTSNQLCDELVVWGTTEELESTLSKCREKSAKSEKKALKFLRIQKARYICTRINITAKIAQLVEHNLAKVGVASSNLVFRSKKLLRKSQKLFLCPYLCHKIRAIIRHIRLGVLYLVVSFYSNKVVGAALIFYPR